SSLTPKFGVCYKGCLLVSRRAYLQILPRTPAVIAEQKGQSRQASLETIRMSYLRTLAAGIALAGALTLAGAAGALAQPSPEAAGEAGVQLPGLSPLPSPGA